MLNKAIKYGAISAAIVLVFAYHLIIQGLPYKIDDPSPMSDALEQRSRVQIVRDVGKARAFEQGQVVIFEEPRSPGTIRTARVIAVEGDRVSLGVRGRLAGYPFVNGELYRRKGTVPSSKRMDEIIVPRDHIFVLGDLRQRSAKYDSARHGPIPLQYVFGWVRTEK